MNTQAELRAALNACRGEEDRVRFLMSLSSTQKAILNFGDDYRPHPGETP